MNIKMTNVLISILTCKQPLLVKRLVQTIFDQTKLFEYDVLVMCNGSEEYLEEVKRIIELSFEKKVLFARSDSNGRPGKGHNSVIRYFSEHSEYKYLLPIDGDDMLYPTAMIRYKKCIDMELDYVGLTVLDLVTKENIPDSKQAFKDIYLYSWMDQDNNKWFQYPRPNPYTNLDECRTPSRPLIISRNMLYPGFRYSETMNEKEDFILHISVMDLAYSTKLKIFFTSDTFIYCYDRINHTSVSSQGKTKEEFDENKREFLSEVQVYKNVNEAVYDLKKLRFIKFSKLEYTYESKVAFVLRYFLQGYFNEGVYCLQKKRYTDAFAYFKLLYDNGITDNYFKNNFAIACYFKSREMFEEAGALDNLKLLGDPPEFNLM